MDLSIEKWTKIAQFILIRHLPNIVKFILTDKRKDTQYICQIIQ